MLSLLLALTIAQEPISIYFEPGSCRAGSGLIRKLEAASIKEGIPVKATILPQQADYLVKWGTSISGGFFCFPHVRIADGKTGEILVDKGMPRTDKNKFRDFFGYLKRITLAK